MTRGGSRPNSGRKPSTGRTRKHGGQAVYVMFSADERAELELVLREGETAASLIRDAALKEARRRT